MNDGEGPVPRHVQVQGALSSSAEDEARERIFMEMLGLLQKEYAAAKEIHLHNETSTRRRDVVGLANLRDTLDHTSRVLKALFVENDMKKAGDNTAQLKEHLYRAMNEGAESAAEYHLVRAEKKRLPQIVYWLALMAAPKGKELDEAIETAWMKIKLGRKGKGVRHATPEEWLAAVDSFKSAEEIAKGIDRDLPARRDVIGRMLFTVVLGAAGLVLAILGIVL